jgi:hypothetical protein
MASPICLVNSSSTINGVNVSGNSTITISLQDTAGVKQWSIQCISTDELHNKNNINNSLLIDLNTKTATFTSPIDDGYGSALIFESKINNGLDVNGRADSSLRTTFGIYIITGTARRVHAVNETTESNAEFGYTPDFNDVIRNINTSTGLIPSDAGDGLILSGSALNVVPGQGLDVGPNEVFIESTIPIINAATPNSTASSLALRDSNGDILFRDIYNRNYITSGTLFSITGDQGGSGTFSIRTSNQTTLNSRALSLGSGNSTSGASGLVAINSGTAGTISGSVFIESGFGTNISGSVQLSSGLGGTGTGTSTVTTGSVNNGTSGNTTISTGSSSIVGFGSGIVTITSGTATSGNSGNIIINSGNSTSGTSGNISLIPGTGSVNGAENIALLANPASWQSGRRVLFLSNRTTIPTGNPSNGLFLYSESGVLNIIDAAAGVTAPFTLSASSTIAGGTQVVNTSYIFKTANVTGTDISRNLIITSGTGTIGTAGSATGSVSITTGAASTGGTGSVFISTGASTSGGKIGKILLSTANRVAGSTEGNIDINTGNSIHTSADINLLTGQANGNGNTSGNISIVPGSAVNGAKIGNICLGSYPGSLSGERIIYISNASNVPTSDPVGGGYLYVQSGQLRYRGSSGSVTILANA